jgi:hypothetical protein
MKALILNNKVVDVKEVEFEVHNTMIWVDCSNDIKIGYRYDGRNFISNLPSEEEIAKLEQDLLLKESKKESAIAKLKALGLTEEEIKSIL